MHLHGVNVINEEIEQLRVQLAGCLVAAEGHVQNVAKKGDYGWSVAYEQTLQLRLKYENLLKRNKQLENEITSFGYRYNLEHDNLYCIICNKVIGICKHDKR